MQHLVLHEALSDILTICATIYAIIHAAIYAIIHAAIYMQHLIHAATMQHLIHAAIYATLNSCSNLCNT